MQNNIFYENTYDHYKAILDPSCFAYTQSLPRIKNEKIDIAVPHSFLRLFDICSDEELFQFFKEYNPSVNKEEIRGFTKYIIGLMHLYTVEEKDYHEFITQDTKEYLYDAVRKAFPELKDKTIKKIMPIYLEILHAMNIGEIKSPRKRFILLYWTKDKNLRNKTVNVFQSFGLPIRNLMCKGYSKKLKDIASNYKDVKIEYVKTFLETENLMRHLRQEALVIGGLIIALAFSLIPPVIGIIPDLIKYTVIFIHDGGVVKSKIS